MALCSFRCMPFKGPFVVFFYLGRGDIKKWCCTQTTCTERTRYEKEGKGHEYLRDKTP